MGKMKNKTIYKIKKRFTTLHNPARSSSFANKFNKDMKKFPKACIKRPSATEKEIAVCEKRLQDLEASAEPDSITYEKRKMIALNRLAALYRDMNLQEQALQAYGQVIQVTKVLAEKKTKDKEMFLRRLANAFNESASLTIYPDEAEKLYLNALRALLEIKELPKSLKNEKISLIDILTICSELLALYYREKREKKAWELYEYIQSLYTNPDNLQENLEERITIIRHLTLVFVLHGDSKGAKMLLHKKVELYEELCEKNENYLSDLASSYEELALETEDDELKKGLYLKALELYQQTDALTERKYENPNTETLHLEEQTNINKKLAELCACSGCKEEAKKYIADALKCYELNARYAQERFFDEMQELKIEVEKN